MRRTERGMVTAEIAISSLVLVAVAAGMVGIFGMILTQIRCTDAASEIARQSARGDQAAADRVSRQLPPGATVATSRPTAGVVKVTVTVAVRPVLPIPITVDLVGQASAALEPGIR